MNEERLSVEDECFKNLWYLTNYIKRKHNLAGNATRIKTVKKHKDLVEDLIAEITEALDNFANWTSGKNRLPQILRLRLALARYRIELYSELSSQPARSITNFNNNKNRFQTIITDILELFQN